LEFNGIWLKIVVFSQLSIIFLEKQIVQQKEDNTLINVKKVPVKTQFDSC